MPADWKLRSPSTAHCATPLRVGLLRALPLRWVPLRAMAPRVVSLWRLLQQQQKSTQCARPLSTRSNRQWLPSICRSQSHRDLAICGSTSGNSGERASGVAHSCSALPQRGESAAMLPRASAAAPADSAVGVKCTSGGTSVSFGSEARLRAAIAARKRALLELLGFEQVPATIVPAAGTA